MNLLRKLSLRVRRDSVGSLRSNNAMSRARLLASSLGVGSVLICSFLLFSQAKPTSQPAQSANPSPSASATTNMLTDAQMSHMSSNELAKYVFDHHGCNSCHTLGANGKLGFTERGKQVGKGFEGCISLLTSMNIIAQVKPADRSSDDKQKAATFQAFGCTTCHQITPGKLGLTSYGTKLKSLHMACTDVERILAQQR
jgi:cytochrome c551/c552